VGEASNVQTGYYVNSIIADLQQIINAAVIYHVNLVLLIYINLKPTYEYTHTKKA